MKRFAKIVVDVLMFAGFLYLLSYGTVRDLVNHAYIGIFLFVLFFIHHGLNFWFYKTLRKGKWNGRRIALNITDWLLFALMVTMGVSSVLMSGYVFEWSPFETTQGYRELHLISCSWGFMVMLIHLGFHLDIKFKKLETRCKKWQKIFLFAIYAILIATGIYCFVESELYVYMFNTGAWKKAASSSTIAALQLLGISGGTSILTHLGIKLFRKS